MLKKISAVVLMVGLMSLTPVTLKAQGDEGKQEERHEGRERHPSIRAAIRALEKAKSDLQHADHDFGGHREEAVEAIDNAIKQLNEALKYDRK
ncbi:MAG TPA: hypothetical protein VK699_08080 [Terriglobales bacterium]|jgi:hypothetical protein|nr:hypothetical protein [Terriglobales bacterium]